MSIWYSDATIRELRQWVEDWEIAQVDSQRRQSLCRLRKFAPIPRELVDGGGRPTKQGISLLQAPAGSRS